jgi:hypothetical protein
MALYKAMKDFVGRHGIQIPSDIDIIDGIELRFPEKHAEELQHANRGIHYIQIISRVFQELNSRLTKLIDTNNLREEFRKKYQDILDF